MEFNFKFNTWVMVILQVEPFISLYVTFYMSLFLKFRYYPFNNFIKITIVILCLTLSVSLWNNKLFIRYSLKDNMMDLFTRLFRLHHQPFFDSSQSGYMTSTIVSSSWVDYSFTFLFIFKFNKCKSCVLSKVSCNHLISTYSKSQYPL